MREGAFSADGTYDDVVNVPVAVLCVVRTGACCRPTRAQVAYAA